MIEAEGVVFVCICVCSTITSLSSRMDKLEAELEVVKSARVQRTGSSRQRGEVTPRYGRRDRMTNNDHKRWSTESSASMTSYHEGHKSNGPFRWQMPFTVKCIGTFRCAARRLVDKVYVFVCE